MNKYELLGYKKKFCFWWVTKWNFITHIYFPPIQVWRPKLTVRENSLNHFQQRQASSLHTNSKHNWTKKPDAADSDHLHFPDRIFKSKGKADTHTIPYNHFKRRHPKYLHYTAIPNISGQRNHTQLLMIAHISLRQNFQGQSWHTETIPCNHFQRRHPWSMFMT